MTSIRGFSRFYLHKAAGLFRRFFSRSITPRLEYTCRVCYDRYHPRGCVEKGCPYAR